MKNIFEGGFHIRPNTHLVLGLTESGQGKATGAYTLLPYLGDVPILRPSDGGFVTQKIWERAHNLYLKGDRREEGTEEWKIKLANLELLNRLRKSRAHLLSMHGIFGYGAGRTVLEIDRKVEPAIAVQGTRALVPLPETADELRRIGRERGIYDQEIEIVGFLTPDIIKDEASKQRRIETLSQKGPTRENPLILAFMSTGQFRHLDILRDQILTDEYMKQGMKDRTIRVHAYMWNDAKRAKAVGQFAHDQGLDVIVTDQYEPELDVDVQIYYNPNPQTAVEGSMEMASRATIVASPIAERIGWTPELPFIAVPSFNAKTESNTHWAITNGLATPLENGQGVGDLIPEFFRSGNSNVDRHYSNAHQAKTVFQYGDLTGGAQKAAELVLARL